MYVCVCNAVTEREVYKAVKAGATSAKALSRQLGVGSQCGSCVTYAKECIDKVQHQGSKFSNNVTSINKKDVA